MKIDNFFPTPISQVKLFRNVNKDEIDFINDQRKYVSQNIGNFSSINTYILNTPELQEVKEMLTLLVNQYFKTVFDNEPGTELYITNSWVNWTDNGGYHHIHKHTNSLVSGVLYIQTSQDDEIDFINPNKFLGNINIKPIQTTLWNKEHWSYNANENNVILFPSTLEHGVNQRPHTCYGTRISLSFNTWVKGRVGDARACNELIIE